MICGKCGNNIPDGAKFCTECGNPVQEQTVEPHQQSHETIIQNTPVLQYSPSLELESSLSDAPAQRIERSAPLEPEKHFERPVTVEPVRPYRPVLQQKIPGEPFISKVAVPVLVMLLLTLIFTFIVFILIDTQPGDPAMIPLSAAVTEADLQQLRSELQLDSPLIVRYARALTGNYGLSYMTRQPVSEMIRERIPTTIKLILTGMIVTLILSLPLGIASAVRRNRFIDALTAALSMVFKSIPFYVIALVSLLWLSIGLGVLPVAGADTWKSYILPGVALGLPCMGVTTKTIRAVALKIASKGGNGLIFPETGGNATQPPSPELGATIRDGSSYLRSASYLIVYPALALIITTLSFNILGESLIALLQRTGQTANGVYRVFGGTVE